MQLEDRKSARKVDAVFLFVAAAVFYSSSRRVGADDYSGRIDRVVAARGLAITAAITRCP
jgi:hypothetical protein